MFSLLWRLEIQNQAYGLIELFLSLCIWGKDNGNTEIFSYKATNPITLGPIVLTSCNFNDLLNVSLQIESHQGFRHMTWGGGRRYNSAHSTSPFVSYLITLLNSEWQLSLLGIFLVHLFIFCFHYYYLSPRLS